MDSPPSGLNPLARLRDLFVGGRLLLAIAVGGVAFLVAPAAIGVALRGTAGWVIGIAAFLGLTLLATGNCSLERIRARARALDERAWVILVLVVAAAAASFGALGFVLRKPPGGESVSALALALAGLTVTASWLLVHTNFALHYAHTYYDDDPDEAGDADRGGLLFPGKASPDYWDFFYYSFVVGMTCQVSDVQVTSRTMRRLTLVHGIVAFFFNTGVLALAINILANAL
jgi:uncharacterized membrane protein